MAAPGREYKVVLAGAFGSGKTTFASQFVKAKAEKKKIPAIKAETFPVNLYTSAGTVKLTLYDTTLHAKGGIPDDGFFRNAEAMVLFYDITKRSSYEALEEWHNAFTASNGRKGSTPLPVIVVGTKLDQAKDRAVAPKDIDYARKRELPYVEISAKANYKVKELLLGMVRLLLGSSTQLTDQVELEKESAEVDEAQAVEAKKAYDGAGKKS